MEMSHNYTATSGYLQIILAVGIGSEQVERGAGRTPDPTVSSSELVFG
jgi:hypothetical protein